MPYVPLVDITVRLVSGWLAMTAVRRTAMVIDTGILGHHCGQDAFVNVSGREIGVPEVACLIGIIKLKAKRLSESIIYPIS